MDLQIKQSYTFSPWPDVISVLGNKFNNVTVLDVLSRGTAEMFTDITAAHQQLLPYLPAGTSSNPEDFLYYKIQLSSGATTIISSGWINPDTVEITTTTRINVVVSNVSISDIPKIKNALVSNGFDQVAITLV